MQWSVRACELWDLSWHDLLEHLPTPSAFVTPSLPPIVVLNTPCGSMRSHLFTWKSSTGIVPVCSAFSRKNKWVLSFKRKSYFLLFFFWLFYLILQLITCFSPSFLARSPGSWFPPGGATVPFPSPELWLCYASSTRGMSKEGQAEWNFTQSKFHSAIPRFPCKSC